MSTDMLREVTACSAAVNRHRPDRGPERRCGRPSRYLVRAKFFTEVGFVCGIHAREWRPDVLVPVFRSSPVSPVIECHEAAE